MQKIHYFVAFYSVRSLETALRTVKMYQQSSICNHVVCPSYALWMYPIVNKQTVLQIQRWDVFEARAKKQSFRQSEKKTRRSPRASMRAVQWRWLNSDVNTGCISSRDGPRGTCLTNQIYSKKHFEWMADADKRTAEEHEDFFHKALNGGKFPVV